MAGTVHKNLKRRRPAARRRTVAKGASSPAVGNARNDRVARGSNPRFSSAKGSGRLTTSRGVKSSTKTAARKVGIKSGIKGVMPKGVAKINRNVRSTRNTRVLRARKGKTNG